MRTMPFWYVYWKFTTIIFIHLKSQAMGTLIFMVVAGIMVVFILVVFYLKKNKVRDKNIKKELITHNDNKTSDWE